MMFSRLPIFAFDLIINPDEALMAANAMQADHGWIDWNFVDSLTSGPLNSMVLTWPAAFGGDITLFSTRLTGAVLFGSSLNLLAYSLRAFFGKRVSVLTVIPMYVYFISTTDADFVHYASEILPIFLTSFGIWLFTLSFRSERIWWLVGASLCFGLVLWAKLQAAPIAAVCGCFVLFRTCTLARTWAQRAQALSAEIVFACAPALLFLVPLAIAGGIDDFYKSFFVQQRLRFEGVGLYTVPCMIIHSSFWIIVCLYSAAVLLSVALIVFAKQDFLRLTPAMRLCTGLAAALVPVSYVAIALPGRPYAHYLLLSIPSMVLAGGTAISVITQYLIGRCGLVPKTVVMCWVAPLVLLSVAAQLNRMRPWAYERSNGAYLQGKLFSSSRSLQWLRPQLDDRLLCWGWQAECYVNAAIRPATREATNENQLYATSLRGYFRTRFMEDLLRSRPDFIVDAVAPGSFRFDRPKEFGMNTFPELRDLIARDYSMISTVTDPDTCPKVYVKKPRLAELESALIHFKSVTASATAPGFSPASLDDGSIFETCQDYWLAPDSVGGSIKVEFEEPNRVKSIAILNTRNGEIGDRSSGELNVALTSRGYFVKTVRVKLNAFPHWTFIDIPESSVEVDGMNVEIQTFTGKGGGLNEIKVYRK